MPNGSLPPDHERADAAYVSSYHRQLITPPHEVNRGLGWDNGYGPQIDIDCNVPMTVNPAQSDDEIMQFIDEMVAGHPTLLPGTACDSGHSIGIAMQKQADGMMVQNDRNEDMRRGALDSGADGDETTRSVNASGNTQDRTSISKAANLATDTSSQLSFPDQTPTSRRGSMSIHSASQHGDIGRQLLDAQARLCGRENGGEIPLSDEIGDSLKEAEHLLGLMEHHFRSTFRGEPDEACHPPRYSPTPPQAPRATRTAHNATNGTSAAIVTFMYLSCYLYLLEKYERVLLELQRRLRHNSGSKEDDNHSNVFLDFCSGDTLDSGGIADASHAYNYSESHKASTSTERHVSETIEDLGNFQIFDSIELNAAYLVPLISLMINRLHGYAKSCLGPAASEYGKERGFRFAASGSSSSIGSRRGAKHQAMARISGQGTDYVFETYNRVLDVATKTEQLISS